MDNDFIQEKPDLTLSKIKKQDLYDLSVSDLEERISNLTNEIERCRSIINDRGDTRAAAEQLFKT
ncbi:MAG: DUF1192 domain-containing protein [Pseudomonadota bacterium]